MSDPRAMMVPLVVLTVLAFLGLSWLFADLVVLAGWLLGWPPPFWPTYAVVVVAWGWWEFFRGRSCPGTPASGYSSARSARAATAERTG